jgi:hypothetical protein
MPSVTVTEPLPSASPHFALTALGHASANTTAPPTADTGPANVRIKVPTSGAGETSALRPGKRRGPVDEDVVRLSGRSKTDARNDRRRHPGRQGPAGEPLSVIVVHCEALPPKHPAAAC